MFPGFQLKTDDKVSLGRDPKVGVLFVILKDLFPVHVKRKTQ